MSLIPDFETFINEQSTITEIVNLLVEANIDLIDESFEKKDLDRVKSIFKKAKGSDEKTLQLVRNMAKSIKDPKKARARGEAIASIIGDENEASKIFFDRATELGGKKPKDLKIGSVIPGGKTMGKIKQTKVKYYGPREKGSAILPLGSVKLETGDSKIFNVYDTWKNMGRTMVEVWKDHKGKHRLLFTSGDKPYYIIGSKNTFYHDQNFGAMFGGYECTLVDWAKLEDMRDLIPKYGKSLFGYVYK